jgi:hypothetical protein
MRLIIEDPQEASDRGLIEADKPLDLSLLWVELNELESEIGSLMIQRDIFHRQDQMAKITLSRMVKNWVKYSKFARSTKSMVSLKQ